MSTLQALCEAAEMSVELPVSTNQSSTSSSTQQPNVEGSAAPTHLDVAMAPANRYPALTKAGTHSSYNSSTQLTSAPYKADARDTDSPTFLATSEQRDAASSPIAHYHPTIDLNTMALDAPKSVAANTKGASSKGGKPMRKRGWVKKSWEERLMELKAYKAVNGDCNVPTLSKTNPSLGTFLFLFILIMCASKARKLTSLSTLFHSKVTGSTIKENNIDYGNLESPHQ